MLGLLACSLVRVLSHAYGMPPPDSLMTMLPLSLISSTMATCRSRCLREIAFGEAGHVAELYVAAGRVSEFPGA